MIVPIMIPIQSYPQYVKRADLDSFLQKYTKRARVGFIVVIVAGLFFQAVMGFLIMPKMLGLYSTINQPPPSYAVPLLLISVALGLVFLTVAVMSNPLDTGKVEKVRQDKEEMVTINGSLVSTKLAFLFWGYIAVFVLVIILTMILPIAALTSSLGTK